MAEPVLRPRTGVLTREVDRELVLLDTKTERYLGLNESGARMWALATSLANLDAVLDALESEFPDASRERLERDFAKFASDVRAAGLAH